MTAFSMAWDVVKMPFITEDMDGRGIQSDRLYQGRRTGEADTGYWTPHKSKAMAYAMFGPRYAYTTSPFVDPMKHYPELHMATAPKDEYVEVPIDEEYMGSGQNHAVSRGRVAYHDTMGVLDPYKEKLPDSHVAQIIQNIIDSELYDDEIDDFEEQLYDSDKFDEVFMHPKGGRWLEWESMYPDLRGDDPEGSRLYEELDNFYGEDPIWDLVTTNSILAGDSSGGLPNDFVRRLRERGQ